MEVCDIVQEAVIKTIPVTVFIDQDLGTGVDEKKDTWDSRLMWNKFALFVAAYVYISLYKEVLGSKNRTMWIAMVTGPKDNPYPE